MTRAARRSHWAPKQRQLQKQGPAAAPQVEPVGQTKVHGRCAEPSAAAQPPQDGFSVGRPPVPQASTAPGGLCQTQLDRFGSGSSTTSSITRSVSDENLASSSSGGCVSQGSDFGEPHEEGVVPDAGCADTAYTDKELLQIRAALSGPWLVPPPDNGRWVALEQPCDTTIEDLDVAETERVERIARSFLNKLTVEKFEALFEQLASCGSMRTAGHFRILVQEIFHKSTTQHHFTGMYADLCMRIQEDARFAAAAGSAGNIRRLLLSACQGAFEGFVSAPPSTPGGEDAHLHKRRALGNVKLIGHLLVRGMLSDCIVVACASSLIASHEACPDALELLAALLTIVGRRFDDPSWALYEKFNCIFAKTHELAHCSTVSPRNRFLLRDVLDLRKAGWQERFRESLEPVGPMSLGAVREQQEEETAFSPMSRQKTKSKGKSKVIKLQSLLDENKAQRSSPTSAISPTSTIGTPSFSCTSVATQASTMLATVPMPAEQDTYPAEPAAAAKDDEVMLEKDVFNAATFRRKLSVILKDLHFEYTVAGAVKKIRELSVPLDSQADEFADILTRAAEENRGASRRAAFAFAAGLAASENSAFDRTECLLGAAIFFSDIYEQLCIEVPRLNLIVTAELLPTLRSVFPISELRSILPAELRNV